MNHKTLLYPSIKNISQTGNPACCIIQKCPIWQVIVKLWNSSYGEITKYSSNKTNYSNAHNGLHVQLTHVVKAARGNKGSVFFLVAKRFHSPVPPPLPLPPSLSQCLVLPLD